MTRNRRFAPPWFGPKLGGVPGVSFTPICWQGWAATVAFILLTGATFALPVTQKAHALIFAGSILLFGIVGRVCYDPTAEPS